MLPQGWIPHRRADGEVLGWIELDGDDVVAFDLLGRRVTAPGVDWHEAEQALERRGIGYLADQYTLTLPDDDTFVPVRIGEATADHVTVVEDEFGGASVVGAEPRTHVLPFPVPAGLLRDYVRPRIDLGTWPDANGRPIEYGSVYWGGVEPASEVYSTCAHPERFEPVVIVARALLDHLERTYDVDRTEEVDDQTRLMLTPRSGDGTALTMILPLSGLPGVEVTAGYRYRGIWPDCGCDACDDAVPDLLDSLETTVFGIVEGTMSEWRSGPDGETPWTVHVQFDLYGTYPSLESGWSAGEPEPLDLPTTPHRWGAWPLRTD